MIEWLYLLKNISFDIISVLLCDLSKFKLNTVKDTGIYCFEKYQTRHKLCKWTPLPPIFGQHAQPSRAQEK